MLWICRPGGRMSHLLRTVMVGTNITSQKLYKKPVGKELPQIQNKEPET